MERLDRFWRALEILERPAHSLAGWRELLGPENEIVQRFLRPTDRLATSYPCPDPTGENCPRGVVDHGGGDIVAVCRDKPRRCEPVSVSRGELIIYELNVTTLASEISEALEVAAQLRETGVRSTWQLGTQPSRERATPVYLTLRSSTDELESVVANLLIAGDPPFVLLTPTSVSESPRCRDLLRGASSRSEALEHFVEADPRGALAATAGLGKLSDEPAPKPCVFRRKGRNFLVSFYDDQMTPIPVSKGLHYIQELLRNPGRTYHPSELEPLTGTIQPGSQPAREDELSLQSGAGESERIDALALVPSAHRYERWRTRFIVDPNG